MSLQSPVFMDFSNLSPISAAFRNLTCLKYGGSYSTHPRQILPLSWRNVLSSQGREISKSTPSNLSNGVLAYTGRNPASNDTVQN